MSLRFSRSIRRLIPIGDRNPRTVDRLVLCGINPENAGHSSGQKASATAEYLALVRSFNLLVIRERGAV